MKTITPFTKTPGGQSPQSDFNRNSKQRNFHVLLFTLIVSAALNSIAQQASPLEQLARDAISQDPAISAPAMAELRSHGSDGLKALFDVHGEILQRRTTPAVPSLTPDVQAESWQRLKAALDTVGQQRDCYASGLYWYTDFEQARTAAKVSGKPILSLRLLGKLDEEFSCANSRFFRTTLYANEDVSRYLRDHFILHWKSVRPVPKVTIDFGDGRKVERTITGNSIHYVLGADGRVIDALPGLYGPQAFLRGLEQAEGIARQCSSLTDEKRDQALREYHRTRLTAIEADWTSDLTQVRATAGIRAPAIAVQPISSAASPPPAQVAARVAVGKGQVEMPILLATLPKSPSRQDELETATDDATWARIAALHTEDAKLDSATTALMRTKNPNAFDAGRLTMTKVRVEDPLLRAVRNLERSIAEDTVRNEYSLHARIHEWLAESSASADVEKLNSKVYAELFLTPDSDPWLGLVPRDTYTALENDGLVLSVKR